MSYDTRLLQTIEAIYEAGLDPDRWPTVIANVASQIGGHGGALHFADLAGSGFMFGRSHAVDPRCLSDYASYFYSVNPLHRGLMQQKANTVVADHQLVARSEMTKTEVYNDHFVKYGIGGSATAVIANDTHKHISFAILTAGDIFQLRDLEILALLLPHIARAMRMNQKLELLSGERDTFSKTLDLLAAPVILVDEAGRLLHTNSVADQILREGDGLTVRHRKLWAPSPAENATLRTLIASASNRPCVGGEMIVNRLSGKRPLVLSVCPIARNRSLFGAAAVAIILNNTDIVDSDTPGSLLRAFRVTPAEANVVMAVVRGEDLARWAEDNGVSAVTARNQLKRAMAKMGTHRQADLVRVVLTARSSIVRK